MIIGASTHRAKFGNKAVRAYVRRGHEVLPVNPHAEEVEGIKCFSNVADVPGFVDRALFYVPPPIGLHVIEEIAARGEVGELWLNPGAESPELAARAEQLGVPVFQACAIVDIGERP